jgi:hypothetical protein
MCIVHFVWFKPTRQASGAITAELTETPPVQSLLGYKGRLIFSRCPGPCPADACAENKLPLGFNERFNLAHAYIASKLESVTMIAQQLRSCELALTITLPLLLASGKHTQWTRMIPSKIKGRQRAFIREEKRSASRPSSHPPLHPHPLPPFFPGHALLSIQLLPSFLRPIASSWMSAFWLALLRCIHLFSLLSRRLASLPGRLSATLSASPFARTTRAIAPPPRAVECVVSARQACLVAAPRLLQPSLSTLASACFSLSHCLRISHRSNRLQHTNQAKASW